MKTLSEVVNIVGMTRRVIQEYEKAGLSKTPKTTNKYGHLLYDDKTIERLCQIRFYRDLGYNKKQIREILSDPDRSGRIAVDEQLEILEKQKERLEGLIASVKASEKWGMTPSSVQSCMPIAKNVSYDMISSVLGAVCKGADGGEAAISGILSEEDMDEMADAISLIYDCFENGLSVNETEVKRNVKRLHSAASKAISDSVIFFSICSLFLSPGTELSEAADEQLGKGFSKYLFLAVKEYCASDPYSPSDRIIISAVNELERLWRKKYSPCSEEAMNEVKKLYGFYENIAAIPPEARLGVFGGFGKIFESSAVKEQLDNDSTAFSGFISEAIRIFCERFDTST